MPSSDNFYVKSIKYYAYKKYFGGTKWRNNYLFERAARLLRPGDIAIDCGAHIGRYTRMLADTGATVHAFEPDPRNFARLEQNLTGRPNVILHNAAVDAEAGTAKLYTSNKFQKERSNREGSTIVKEKDFIDKNKFFTVEKVDFINFIKNIGKDISLIKMDIEGAELPILSRMIEENSFSKIEKMFVETHEDQIPEKRGEYDILKKEIEKNFGDKVDLDWH
jgi:FkbM family methyltransferase